jgi:hypothetical protein
MDGTIDFNNQFVFGAVKISNIKCFPVIALNDKYWKLA